MDRDSNDAQRTELFLERAVRLVRVGRYSFLFIGVLVIVWRMAVAYEHGEGVGSRAMMEIGLFGIIFPLLLWAGAGWVERLTREAMRSVRELSVEEQISRQDAAVTADTSSGAGEFDQSNRTEDPLLRAVSQEVRTPLTTVMGYTGIIRDQMLGQINPRQEEALEQVMIGSREILNLINGVLDASKVEALKEQVLRGSRPLSEALSEFEREMIVKALQRTGFNQTRAASLLGTTRRVLAYRMEKLKIAKDDFAVGKGGEDKG